MNRLLPNDFHVVERPAMSEEEQQQEEEAMQDEPQRRRRRRVIQKHPVSRHLTPYALRNCCRVLFAMRTHLGSDELMMDTMIHYLNYK